MPTPSPSLPISLSPPSAGERLARCTAPPALSSPPPVPSPLLPSLGVRHKSETHSIGHYSGPCRCGLLPALPSPLTTTTTTISIHTTTYLAEVVPEIAPMTVGEVNTRVTKLAELHECDTYDLYALQEDTQDGDRIDCKGGGLCFSRGMGSLNRIESGDPSGSSETPDMRREMSDKQAKLLAIEKQQRRAMTARTGCKDSRSTKCIWDAESPHILVNKARGAQIHWGSLFGKSHNALGYSTFRCHPDFGGVTNWYQSQGYREPAVMSSASFAVTYTSVYTDSEPGRVFWGADEEISDGGSPRVIVLGYDGLPIQPVAPPSPDYIPGPEEPQTPPVPQDEDEREPMFIQPHDPDYVPEPIYPEYIPLEDEHEFPAEEQPLPPVVSPTAESPGYVVESDPEEDPEEYEDDETEDGLVDYPMDEGEDGDDDDDDEDGKEEEEHLALANSVVVVPTVELVSPPEGIESVIPPPSTDITTTGAKITVRLQASISLPPEAEVERLLAMPTPPPSPPPISLSPPSTEERLARCMAPSAHSSPPPVPSPLLPSSGCPTQIQTLKIASTQALVDSVTATLPSPPLPPSLYIPPPIDCRDDIPESESHLMDPAEAIPEIAPVTLGEVSARVVELAELHEHDTHELYALLEDAQDSRTRIS
ncbi:hypothetical protein Tco_1184347 [Tanacetum coccineum]